MKIACPRGNINGSHPLAHDMTAGAVEELVYVLTAALADEQGDPTNLDVGTGLARADALPGRPAPRRPGSRGVRRAHRIHGRAATAILMNLLQLADEVEAGVWPDSRDATTPSPSPRPSPDALKRLATRSAILAHQDTAWRDRRYDQLLDEWDARPSTEEER